MLPCQCASPKSGRTAATVGDGVSRGRAEWAGSAGEGVTDGLHRAAVIVAVVRLGVAVVEAAAAVVVRAGQHGVDRLRVVAGRDALGLVDVVSEPGVEPVWEQPPPAAAETSKVGQLERRSTTAHEARTGANAPHTVDLLAAGSHFVLGSVHKLVASAEVVLHRRLIHHVRDDAVKLRAEGVVRRDVGVATGGEHADQG
eukprot:SAG11_NODE_577_length_8382_cov_36.300374_5_plen_199_part_00